MPSLWTNKVVGPTGDICISPSIYRSQTTSQPALTVPLYSTSVKDREIAYYFLLVHVTTLDLKLNTYLEVVFLLSTKPTQSGSMNPLSLGLELQE